MTTNRLRIWKHIDYDYNDDDNNNNNNPKRKTMLINGNSMSEQQVIDALAAAMNDDDCDVLDLREIDFDIGPCAALINAVTQKQAKPENENDKQQSNNNKKKNDSSNAPWKEVRITHCHGYVNDVITGCMAIPNKIKSFHLQSQVNTQTIYALTYGLRYNTFLTELALTIDFDTMTANSLSRGLARNTTLKSLNLAGSTIQGSAANPIGFAFRLNKTLEKFNIDSCYLNDDQVATILQALQDHPSLKVLSLQQNSCHDQGMGCVAALLHYNDLEELDLSYLIRKKKEPKPRTPTPEPEEEEEPEEEVKEEEGKDTSEDDGETKEDTKDDDAEENEEEKEEDKEEEKEEEKEPEPEPVQENKVINTSLKVLQLAGNGLSDEFLDSILGILGKGNALEQLNMFGNRLTDNGISKIIQKLPQLEHLKILWLGQNNFSLLGGKCLLEAVKSNYQLEDINIRTLDSNPIWDNLQRELDHYTRLNRGGRRIFSATNDPDKSIPLGLWPLVLERANRIFWGASTRNTSTEASNSHAADTIFCLLHSPVLFENPNLPTTAS